MDTLMIQLAHLIENFEKEVISMKKIISFLFSVSFVLTMVPTLVNATNEQAAILESDEITNSVIIEEDSVLFYYSVDKIQIFTNNMFESEFEGENCRFYPEKDGKYIVSTAKFNMDVSDILENPDAAGISSVQQNYIVEKTGDKIIVAFDSELSFPAYEPNENEQLLMEMQEQNYSLANKEISEDHYFKYTKVRGTNQKYYDSTFCVNSESDGLVYNGGTHPYRLVSETKLNGISSEIEHYEGCRLTSYDDMPVNDGKFRTVKRENDLLTVYSGNIVKGELIPSSLKIEQTEYDGSDWFEKIVAAEAKFTYGDANDDSNVALSDAVMILQAIANVDVYGVDGTNENHITEFGMINADVYETGSGLTPQDALLIQKYLLKLVSELPE